MNTLDYIVNKYHLDIKNKAAVDIPNIGRTDLGMIFRELGFKIGAEIGTEKGVYAEILCEANPNLKLYCIDPWTTYEGYQLYGELMNKNYEEAIKRLSRYGCHIVRKFSMDAVRDFEDGSLDFVYIDGNHNFQNVINDLTEWSKKVKVGGVIAGHDFIKRAHKFDNEDSIPPHTAIRVVEAVASYIKTFNISPLFLLGSKFPKPGEIRDKHRSYMWIKK